jgi:RNA polymerase sigma-70 factor (ECF subfamily)
MMRLETMLRAARAGQPEVWPRLAEVLFKRMYAYFRRWTSDDEAEDLAQTVILRTLERLPKLESEVSLEGWVFGVAYNVWLERQRGEYRHAVRRDDVVALVDVPRTALSSAARWAQLAEFLHEEIGRLPEHLRVAVENKLAEGTIRALADRLGVAPSTVQDWLTKARQRVERGMLARTKTPAVPVSKLTAAPTPPPS